MKKVIKNIFIVLFVASTPFWLPPLIILGSLVGLFGVVALAIIKIKELLYEIKIS